jgi:hypothetical protein
MLRQASTAGFSSAAAPGRARDRIRAAAGLAESGENRRVQEPRSGCPINAAIEVFGDRWSLLVPRDIVFGDRRIWRFVRSVLDVQQRAAGRKPSTIEAYSYWLRIHIVDFFGPMPVGEITRDDVGGFAAALERKGLAPKSRANALGTLHSLIEFAIRSECRHS